MKKELMLLLLGVTSIFGLGWGIFTGNWEPLFVPVAYVMLILTPTYISMYSNWPQAIICPVTLLYALHYVQSNELYAQSEVTDLLLHGIEYTTYWALSAEIILLCYSISDYRKTNQDPYKKYKNFNDYYKNCLIPDIRTFVKNGWEKYHKNEDK